MILKSHIRGDSTGGVFNHGFLFFENDLVVPAGLQSDVIIDAKIEKSDIRSRWDRITVEEGSRLIIRDYEALFDQGLLKHGVYSIGDGASLLFMKVSETPETLTPITKVGAGALFDGIPDVRLTLGKAPETLPSINGFPTRSLDLRLNGGELILKGHTLNFQDDSSLIVEPDGVLEGFVSEDDPVSLSLPSVTRDEAGKPILEGVISLAKMPRTTGISSRANAATGPLPVLTGVLRVTGDTNWPGIIRTGNPVGSMIFDGDLNLEPTTEVHLDIGGPEAGENYDQIEVTGTAALGGKLILYPMEGYEPPESGEFEFVKAPTITGGFVDIDQSRLGRDVRFDFEVGDTGLMATAMPLTITSYADWRAAFFTEPDAADDEISGPDKDPDGDGMTNRMEYLIDGNPNVREGSPVSFSLLAAETPGSYQVAAILDWISDVTDAIVFFETSPDLETWTEVETTTVNEAVDEDFTRSVVNFNDTVDASDRLFIRMNAKEVL